MNNNLTTQASTYYQVYATTTMGMGWYYMFTKKPPP